MTSDPPISVGQVFAGSNAGGGYRIDGLLGAGGMGAVYRVTDVQSGKQHALKLLLNMHSTSPSLARRFDREARALAALSHPNIVHVVDYGTTEVGPYLVMELLEGEDLAARLRRGPPEPREYLALARELLAALAFVHEQGLAHRDIKPGNIFLERRGRKAPRVKVLDFGLAKFVDNPGSETVASPLTRTGEIFGTPGYMAPEQVVGQGSDARSDVYALGAVLYEMLTGRPPFQGPTTEVLRQQLTADPLAPAAACPGLTSVNELDDLLARAMARTPEDRFDSAGSMLSALRRLPKRCFKRGKGQLAMAATQVAVQPVQDLATDPTIVADALAIAAPAPTLARAAAPGRPPARARRPGLLQRLSSSIARTVAFILIAASLVVLFISGANIYLAREQPESAAAAQADQLATKLKGVVAAQGEQLQENVQERVARTQERLEERVEGAIGAAIEGAKRRASDALGRNPLEAERPPAENPWARAAPRLLRDLRRRAQRGGEASKKQLEALRSYNAKHGNDVRGRLLLAWFYTNRGWLRDASEQYENALRAHPEARGAPEVLPNLLNLASRSKTTKRTRELIVEIFGGEARDAVDTKLQDASLEAQQRQDLQALADAL
ncbi:MAG: serine/threonine protein kinase [Myxococcales bacterium]|nr:serine/threonine protein kinase [Myxococcales bacterium]